MTAVGPSKRAFESAPAVRTRVPGLIALVGPPGGGKTESALKLATGMLRALEAAGIPAGKIGVIDSEACRALHYAPKKGEKADPAKHLYDFEHLDFKPPHGPSDYWAATEYMLNEKKCSVLIYDSATHEHTGIGGVLQRQAELVDELSAKWKTSAGAATPSAWRIAKEPRKAWVNELEQKRKVFFIFCFRAKEGVDFEKKGKDMDLGWEPEGGKELFFQMGLSCLLPSRSDGKPLWNSPRLGDMGSMKLPYWAKGILDDGKSINEEHGRKIAEWLLGGENGKALPEATPPAQPAQGQSAPPVNLLDDLTFALQSSQDMTALGKAWATFNAHKDTFTEAERAELTTIKNEAKAAITATEQTSSELL